MDEPRNIPAHAGKTSNGPFSPSAASEHPRARGENGITAFCVVVQVGTSPRTRGKQHKHQISSKLHRNIPAHAGKTWGWRCRFPWCAEHPRARGENSTPATRPRRRRGTSPRTRGKLRFGIRFDIFERNIPAHAGKTVPHAPAPGAAPEHPRARGENCRVAHQTFVQVGTSPRTRGKLADFRSIGGNGRNIPAHAGKTCPLVTWR